MAAQPKGAGARATDTAKQPSPEQWEPPGPPSGEPPDGESVRRAGEALWELTEERPGEWTRRPWCTPLPALEVVLPIEDGRGDKRATLKGGERARDGTDDLSYEKSHVLLESITSRPLLFDLFLIAQRLTYSETCSSLPSCSS